MSVQSVSNRRALMDGVRGRAFMVHYITISGLYSTISGLYSTISGLYSTISGLYATIPGLYSITG